MTTQLTMPRLSDSMEEGTIIKWLVAVGEPVVAGQPLVEVETDKATVTHEAQDAGVILELAVDEGASVPVGAPIAVLGPAGAPIASPVAAAVVADGATRAKASPLARRIAAEAGVPLAGLAGSGPQGRVIRADVERAIANGSGGARARSEDAAAPPAEPGGPAKGSSTFEDLSGVQRTVARRMAESRATVPDIELRCLVDMSRAVALREQLRGVADPLPTYNDLIVKASAIALREFPRVNGAYRDGRFETFSRVNVGIAVAAENALLVPTVFDADAKPLVEIARTTRALAERARDGALTPAELAGGTFTVSNLGMFGIDGFSAIINPPQAAILTVGALARRPVVDDDGAVVARETVELALACDHRILYGADAARFLTRLRELLERPLAVLVA